MNYLYDRLFPLWQIVGDCYEGTEALKDPDRAFVYLPPQPAEREELESGKEFAATRYAFRKQVASYENFFKTTIDDIVGLMGKNPPAIQFGVKDDKESPPEVVDLKYRATRNHDGLAGLKTRLNFSQALFGRYGLLLDVTTDEEGLHPSFVITEYPAHTILDGDCYDYLFDNRKRLRWILLDESTRRFIPGTKTWIWAPRRRVLGLDANGEYFNAVWEGTDVDGVWAQFDLDAPKESTAYRLVYPTYKGKRLPFVPFTVCNADRLGIDTWNPPPYLDVAQIAVGNYLVDSWYKMGLYQFATPTLVVSNAKAADANVRLGGVLWLNSALNSSQGASASILETSGSALSELRNAKQELKDALRYSSIRDLLDGAGANSSGEALALRTSSGTAAIATMDATGARAIEEQLTFAAIWAGATPKEAADRIVFKADTTYLGHSFELGSVTSFIQANAASKILSNRNVYSVLEKTFSGAISSYEDNEAQRIADDQAMTENPGLFALQQLQARRKQEGVKIDEEDEESDSGANESDLEGNGEKTRRRPSEDKEEDEDEDEDDSEDS